MIQGFNHNIQYQGLVFHVQTEQLAQAVYITHIFSEGHIIFTLKSSCGVPDQGGILDRDWIRKQMATQHKKVLKNLIAGKYQEEVSTLLKHREQGGGADTEDDSFSFYLIKGSERTVISEEEISEIMRLSDIINMQHETEEPKPKKEGKKFSFYISTSRQKTRID